MQVGKWFCHDLMLVLVHNVSWPICFVHAHIYAVLFQDVNHLVDSAYVLSCR